VLSLIAVLRDARIEASGMTSSRLVMAGVDLRTVQELLGHKRQAMTLRYALSPEHQQLEAGYSG